jgi:hypothetical protein
MDIGGGEEGNTVLQDRIAIMVAQGRGRGGGVGQSGGQGSRGGGGGGGGGKEYTSKLPTSNVANALIDSERNQGREGGYLQHHTSGQMTGKKGSQ